MTVRFAVLGPGGIGGLLTALLARAGNPVEVLASEASARVIAARGLRLESGLFGDFHVEVQTSTRLDHEVDACLVAVKNTQLVDALERLPTHAVGRALVIPFLNGIDHVEMLRARYGPDAVAAGTIRVETARAEPGLIRHTSPFVKVELASSAATAERLAPVAAALRDAGLDLRVRDDEAAMLWDKLSLLAPLALLTTHERAGAGVIRTRRREDLVAVVSEVAAVAGSEGVGIDAEAVVRLLDSLPETMESSMQRDQAAGQQLEIDAIGGVVVRRAARGGIPVPVIARLVAELEARG